MSKWDDLLEGLTTTALVIYGIGVYLAAPVVMMFSDKAEKIDVIVCLFVPPPADWIYAAWVLLS